MTGREGGGGKCDFLRKPLQASVRVCTATAGLEDAFKSRPDPAGRAHSTPRTL